MSRAAACAVLALIVTAVIACKTTSAAVRLPDPTVDAPLSKAKGSETVVVAGGCFWGIQAVFEHVKGVSAVTAGYAGGSADTAQYETVSSGTTGHAESVKIVYDPSQISYGQL